MPSILGLLPKGLLFSRGQIKVPVVLVFSHDGCYQPVRGVAHRLFGPIREGPPAADAAMARGAAAEIDFGR